MTARLLSLVFFAALALACTTAPARAPRFPAGELVSTTLALVSEPTIDDPAGSVFCSGVWVSDAAILTAAHCVRETPPCEVVWYRAHEGTPRPAMLMRLDPAVDLALLVDPGAPRHPTAPLALAPPAVGTDLAFVGHPGGVEWTFFRGSAAGFADPWLQVSAPVFFGCSGGGAFNDYGELVGIAHTVPMRRVSGSWMLVPAVAFYVPAPAIREFLAAARP
jgi:S1-C subfamily serine protease